MAAWRYFHWYICCVSESNIECPRHILWPSFFRTLTNAGILLNRSCAQYAPLLHTILEEVIIRHARSLLNCHPSAKASIWTDHVLVWAGSGELLIGIQLHNNSLQWPNKILDAAFYPRLNLPPSEVERTPCLDHDTPPKFIRACLQLYLLPPPLMCTLYPSVLTRWLFDNLLMFFFTPHSM